ncbi:DNA polymerase I [Demequina sp. SYSU T0a273]|uniref:DNA polymerase I n=1 Tax=Demequina lignilytica TaxID=3051663 RepID=A0AB35ML96_9MICO|nr:DNA polymerase I [Demequina sp. SYSU T0a273]MDN4484513.1 DNA polymerase I [Demequina sp. SYSU T0a273]
MSPSGRSARDAGTASLSDIGPRLAVVSDSTKGTLLLVDGLSMAFRAFFGLPVENFATSTGVPTNAVYGFTTMLATLLKDNAPTHVAVAFDLPGGTFRTERLPSYKGTRDATPPEFEPQVPLIREMLDALGVVAVDRAGYEADDLLATYARRGREAGMEVLVVSGDRDTIQLVTETVTLLYPRKGVSDLVRFTPDAVEEKYGVRPQQYPDLAALVGETSDNLPGVPKVGPKTAAKWIAAYGGLEGILESADDVPGVAGANLREHVDQVRLNRELNHLLDDMDVEVPLEALEYRGADAAAIHQMCDSLQFRTLRDRLLPFVAGGAEAAPAPTTEEVAVTTDSAVAAIAALPGPVAVHVDGRAGADADAWAIGVAASSATAWGVDLSALDPAEEKDLGAWLADASVPKVLHASKDAWHALQARGWDLEGVVGDTQIAAFLVNPDQRGFELEQIVQRHLGVTVDAGAAGDELDLGLGGGAGRTAGERAALVRALADVLDPMVEERGMGDLYRDLEVPLVAVLARMEHAGMAVDATTLAGLQDEARGRQDRAAEEAYAALDGDRVNLASPKQLQEVLFDRLGMPKTKKIKTGYSTDASSLAELNEKAPHPFLSALLAHRDAAKLAQIIETLAQAVRADGRIHTTFSQTVAATGRLSSKDPNLQNIPIRTPEGHRIREAFVVGAGFETLVTADYSQIEMRIMAHLSGDQGLIEAFAAGEDLHRFVGSRVFHVAPEDVSPEMRAQVKAMSYGLAYGLSSFGLARQLSLPVGAAQALMDDYFARFGAVRDYLRGVVERARDDGYTETIFGRRRYIPDLTSTNRQRREIAERMALNAPIQGSAADLIKRAMLGVERRLRDERLASRQVLQVHDELVVETAPGERDAVEAILRDEMHAAGDLSVPLEVNVGVGGDWRTAGH